MTDRFSSFPFEGDKTFEEAFELSRCLTVQRDLNEFKWWLGQFDPLGWSLSYLFYFANFVFDLIGISLVLCSKSTSVCDCVQLVTFFYGLCSTELFEIVRIRFDASRCQNLTSLLKQCVCLYSVFVSVCACVCVDKFLK